MIIFSIFLLVFNFFIIWRVKLMSKLDSSPLFQLGQDFLQFQIFLDLVLSIKLRILSFCFLQSIQIPFGATVTVFDTRAAWCTIATTNSETVAWFGIRVTKVICVTAKFVFEDFVEQSQLLLFQIRVSGPFDPRILNLLTCWLAVIHSKQFSTPYN